MEKEDFEKIFKRYLEKIQIDIEKEKIEKFYKYMNILLEWNKNINLTAITNPEEIILKHFIDSLTIERYINRSESIIDIGTGADCL